jgi:hypothetical protein
MARSPSVVRAEFSVMAPPAEIESRRLLAGTASIARSLSSVIDIS